MRKTKSRFGSPTLSTADSPALGATVNESVRDLQIKSRQEKVNVAEALRVRFVDDGPTLPLPVFVTRTTLTALLAEEHGDEAEVDADRAR